MSAIAEILPPRPETPRGVEPRLRRDLQSDWTWRFRTRWTDPVTGKRPAAEFDTVAEVLDFRAFLQLSRARGDVARVTRADRTLDKFVQGEYARHVRHRLAANTWTSYESVYRNHLRPHVGPLRLRRLDAPAAADLRDLLLDTGVGAPTVRRALVILQGVFARAVELGIVDVNPIREVTKPPVTRQLAIDAPGPAQIEAVRRELDDASALLVSLLGYEGLRPSEALALEERHIGLSTLLVEQRVINGHVTVGLKTSGRRARTHRSPRLYEPVREDLERHRAQLRRRGAERRLLFPGHEGGPWTPAEYRRWREQIFAPAVKRAGVELNRPYDLRHGCASLLLHARRPVTEIGEHMGHTVATLSDYYSHLIRDLRDQDAVDVEQQIATARA